MASADIRTQNLKKPVDVAEYLFTRLQQLGIRSIHGVPGDYNLVALDYIPKCGLQWVGNCNELNAAYAADGYARVSGMGAVLTTFGVGELSAINGLAGCYSEMVPVVHIVGTPSTRSQRGEELLHHTLGNGDFGVFSRMSADVSCAVARLADPADAAAQIDHALRECYLRSRPVYVALPTDVVARPVEGALLDQPLDLSEPANDTEREDHVVEAILAALHAARRPVVLVDACASRHRAVPEVRALLDRARLPAFVTPMGKSAVDEDHPCFGGVYAGDASRRPVREAVEGADLVLAVGTLLSDFNTAGFSFRLSRLNTVDLHSDRCVVGYAEYPGIRMRGVLRKLADRVDPHLLKAAAPPPRDVPRTVSEAAAVAAASPASKQDGNGGLVSQAHLWEKANGFFREGDVIVTETGTANFGIWETKFPAGVTALNQTLWGSIGWAVGACQGAALAAKDSGKPRRTILFEGDGSLQLTAQEISTMIRHELDVVIFVLCNDGYTIERFIHGMEAPYNDIAAWRHGDMVKAMACGAVENGLVRAYTVRSPAELDSLLERDLELQDGPGLRVVEVFMPKRDAPLSLRLTAEASAKNNARE